MCIIDNENILSVLCCFIKYIKYLIIAINDLYIDFVIDVLNNLYKPYLSLNSNMLSFIIHIAYLLDR